MTVIKAPTETVAATQLLFDMDRLLLNTEQLFSDGNVMILERFNMTDKYNWSIKRQLMGLPALKAAEVFVRETGLPMTAADFAAERNRVVLELFPNCVPLPGVVDFVTAVHDAHMPMAVATSSSRPIFDVKTQHHAALFSHFADHIITGDDARIARGKPAPDIFLVAHATLGGTEETRPTTVVFEDSVAGAKAGLAAGMQVVWVRDARIPFDNVAELEERCLAVTETMSEVEDWFGL
ncbi:HAD hydrolase, family IA [Allomyces macrogynus ATCC 38327]|uniref:HAD hydrolase, family IA n=1 Tax=Allomyces macrogynus (strain ATCC 38327) TaxID=578462 RepID=A0A0L0SZQ9_ALLM3|nr:HAD hydrolase, family IA [Allomyces macrogynus ATCC 38327]|eukprot:KNE68018.1 HAD hydrolase, family IA [Allomyces macrogynus ATCC 38327]